MRTLVFAVIGNDALGARVATLLHEMGHTVHVAADEPGPLRDAAEALGIPVDQPWPAAEPVEWLVRSGYIAGGPEADARHVLAFAARASDFPPRQVQAEWRVRQGAEDRLAASRTCAVPEPLCGADIALEIEAAADDMLIEFVSGLGRDAVQVADLPKVAQAAADELLDLHGLAGWHASNDTARHFELDPSLPEMVARVARRTPAAIALRDEEGEVDYRTFVGASIKLARQLAAMRPAALPRHDAPPVIAVRLRKSRLLYAAMLGAIGSGAAYLPLDPAFPAERVRTILEQSRAICLITDEQYDAQPIADLPVHVLRYAALDAEGIDIAASWPLEHDPQRATRCAVTIFTSGSTGVPKGVMLSHRNIVHFCHWYRDYIELTPASRVLQFCTVAFDVSLLDIFPTFLAGATLVIPTEEQRHMLDELSELIRANALTHAFLPPALLAAMPDAEWPHLRHLLTGGDVCFPETIARWSRGRAFHNIFGPAETTVLATIARLGAGDSNRLIGKPMANVRCYVLDEHGKPVRTGEAGELCIAGAGVADGYLHQPDLTARGFVRNPYAVAGGVWPRAHDERIYRTGDIVQWDQHGALHFVGRRDAQVKIRGFRVELGEVENAILNTGLYGQCACVVDDRKRIRAFVTRPAGAAASPEALQAQLAARLPDFMLPQEVVVLERLPATHNGKIDRATLARMPSQRAASIAVEAEPANDTERKLRALWAGLLDLDEAEIGRDDSFFNLGGHSLLVSRLMLAVKTQFAGNAPLARFMERPTIAALATLLTDRGQKKGDQIPARVYDDMRLPDEVWPVEGVRRRSGMPEAVLLTGANGFLGSFLAAELLAQTRATVYCLIRADDAAAGRARLDQALRANGLGALAGHPRVQVVLGDLAKPKLGLAADVWRHLAREIDAIYHNGAHVNHVYDYPFLYDANVGSTLELLRLACDHRNKSLHFVSTLSAASAMDADGLVLEEGPAMNAPAFVNNGYNVSKWVSEHLVWQALQRGFDVSILRPGNITGVAATGLCQPDRNRILLLVKGSLQLGYAPAGNTAFDFSPVDVLARAMVRCTLDPQRDAAVFHLQNPQPLSWEDYLRALSRLGYDLTLEDPASWRRRLPSIDERNALFDVVAFYLDDSQEDIGDMSRIACERTTATLQRLGAGYPPKDRALLDAHFRYLIHSGFLPPPAAPRGARSRGAADLLDPAPQSA